MTRIAQSIQRKTQANRLPVLLLSLALIVLTMLAGNPTATTDRPLYITRLAWAGLDVLVHAILGALVTWPLALRSAGCRQKIMWLTAAVLAATLVDLDHFLASGTLSLIAATNLDYRPITHSLLFAAICWGVVWLLTRDWRGALLVLAALASHILRDASGGNTPYLLWPLHVDSLPVVLYFGLQLGIAAGVWWLAGRKASKRKAGHSAP